MKLQKLVFISFSNDLVGYRHLCQNKHQYTLVVLGFYCFFRALQLFAWEKNLLGRGCDIKGRLLDCFAIFYLAVDWDSEKSQLL